MRVFVWTTNHGSDDGARISRCIFGLLGMLLWTFWTPAFAQAPQADLVPGPSVLAPNTVYGNYQQVYFYYTLLNKGSAQTTGSFSSSFYYSPQKSLTNAQFLASVAYTKSLPANGSSGRLWQAISLPNTLLSGVGYLILKLDSSNQVSESNEANNVLYLPLRVTGNPDLVVTSLSTSSPLTQGQAFTVNYTLFNRLYCATAKPFPVELWFSYDRYLDTNKDSLLSYALIPSSLRARTSLGTASQPQTLKGKLPATTRAGGATLFLVVNRGAKTPEVDYRNNSRSLYITIKSDTDLKAEKVVPSAKYAYRGLRFNLSWEIKNDKNTVITNPEIWLYFSNDAVITTRDTLLQKVTVPKALAPGTTLRLTSTVTIPANAAAGPRYLGILVDPNNKLSETDKQNNTASEKVEVLVDQDKDGAWTSPNCNSFLNNCDCDDRVNTIKPGGREVCNNKDDNCNGSIDDRLFRFCYSGRAGSENVGVCKGGRQTCANGRWGACQGQVLPSSRENCGNQVDDDCDGAIDEGCRCSSGTQSCGSDVGECKKGTQTCSSSAWGACVGEVKPSWELCDGLDNDCDGLTDEFWPNKGRPCAAGTGGCRKTGTMVCNSDKKTLRCSVTAVPPTAEICDGKDNDCDGAVDENVTRTCFSSAQGKPGQGPCKSGTQRCLQGAFQTTCVGEVLPTQEVCDGKDNDCDGAVDENVTRPCYTASAQTKDVGTCKSGTQRCLNGQFETTCAGEQGPTKESCDGKDNDCNGKVDDGLAPRACKSACGDGQETCTAGAWSACSAPSPQSETCNNKDDDCNGKIDDNLTRSCSNNCGKGTQSCAAGVWSQCSAPQPTQEVCGDGKDNDCDGVIDNPEICKDGGTEPVPDRSECPPCGADEFCWAGSCRSICRCAPCATSGEVCEYGTCVPNKCASVRCKAGSVCVASTGSCIPDPCPSLTCPSGTQCRAGQCQAANCQEPPPPEPPRDGQETTADAREPVVDSPQERERTQETVAEFVPERAQDGSDVRSYDFVLDFPVNSPAGCGCETTTPTLFWWLFLLLLWVGRPRSKRTL